VLLLVRISRGDTLASSPNVAVAGAGTSVVAEARVFEVAASLAIVSLGFRVDSSSRCRFDGLAGTCSSGGVKLWWRVVLLPIPIRRGKTVVVVIGGGFCAATPRLLVGDVISTFALFEIGLGEASFFSFLLRLVSTISLAMLSFLNAHSSWGSKLVSNAAVFVAAFRPAAVFVLWGAWREVFGLLPSPSARYTVVPRAASAMRKCNVVGIGGGNNGDTAGVDDKLFATFAATSVVSVVVVVAVAIGEDGARSVHVGSFLSLSTWPNEVPRSSSTSDGSKDDGGNEGDAGDGAGAADPIGVELVIPAVVFVAGVAAGGFVREVGVVDNEGSSAGVDIPPFIAFVSTVVVSAVGVNKDGPSSVQFG
jgi:hypothetical protein